MYCVKAEILDSSSDEEVGYQYNIELIEIKKILLSVINTHTGVTYTTYIVEDDEWFKSNIYIFQGNFQKVFSILNDSLMYNKPRFNYIEKESHDELQLLINYKDDIFPFELNITIPRYITGNGNPGFNDIPRLEDRIVSLEYQLSRMKHKIKKMKQMKQTVKNGTDDQQGKMYDNFGNLIYEGGIKEGTRHGEGIVYYSDTPQKFYEGGFCEGYYEGEGSFYNKHGFITSKGTYEKGSENGTIFSYSKRINRNDVYLSGEKVMKNGIMNGTSKSFHDNGKTSHISEMKNGLENGTTKYFYDNGKIYHSCEMKNGLQNGNYQQFDKEGKMIADSTYVNGEHVP